MGRFWTLLTTRSLVHGLSKTTTCCIFLSRLFDLGKLSKQAKLLMPMSMIRLEIMCLRQIRFNLYLNGIVLLGAWTTRKEYFHIGVQRFIIVVFLLLDNQDKLVDSTYLYKFEL